MPVIWNSIWLMTISDLLILGVVGYTFLNFYQQTAILTGWRMGSGFLAIGFGLSVLALPYLADLLTMHAFPLVMSGSQSMATMERLYLDARWIIALIGLGAISLGFKYAHHSLSSLVDNLNASKTQLLRELSLRRESEAALRESESRLANAASIARLGYWVWDEIEDKPVYCSEELAEIYGVATGQELVEFLNSTEKNLEWAHPSDRDYVEEVLREARCRKTGYDIEFRIVRTDGEVRYVREILEPVLDEQGNLIRLNGIIQDITETKRAEETMRQLHSAIEVVVEPITLYDADDRIVFCNKKYRALNSAVPETFEPGTTFEQHLRAVVARGLIPEATGREEEYVAQRMERHRTPRGPFEIARHEGIHLSVHEHTLPDGRTIVIAADTTDRKIAEIALRDSEARLTKAVEITKIGHRIWDEVEDKAIFCSEELAKTFGVASGVELAAMLSSHAAYLAWVHPDDRERFDEANRIAREAKRGSDIEYRITNAAGEIRHLHEIAEPVLDERGKIVRFNGISQDITVQKQAEEQLCQSQKMEAVGQLTGGVAHDFNNLLVVILLNSEILEDSLGATHPSLLAVTRAANRGAELTRRLLAFSRKQTLQSNVVDLNAIVAGMTDLLRRTLGETIEIEAVNTNGLWKCEVDPGQLENALLNLAINARDAMPKGGELTIETANIRLDDDYAATQGEVALGDYVRLSVTDSGTGMAPEVIERAFEPFFTTKDVGEGTGLGLSMIYGFIKQSGGHIAITSEVGHGTTVNLYLPKSEGAAQATEEPATQEEPLSRGETVLVIEDDEDVRRLVVNVLSRLGYEVLEAGNGEKALVVLHSVPRVDLLLSDVVLPGGRTGPDIVEVAQGFRPGLKSLFISGYAPREMSHRGRLPDGAALLQKPFTRRDLAQKVRAALDG